MKKSRQLKALCACLWLFVGLSVGEAQAVSITWNFQALLTDLTTVDPLGIDGETLNIEITYNTEDAWGPVGGATGPVGGATSFLSFPSESATATITGSHFVTLKSLTPAAVHGNGTSFASVSEQAFTTNFVDFIIDEDTTITTGFQGTSAAIPSEYPSAGENLLPTQLLIPATVTAASIRNCSATGAAACYSLTTVPVPPALYLFGSGLLGLIGISRRKRKCKQL